MFVTRAGLQQTWVWVLLFGFLIGFSGCQNDSGDPVSKNKDKTPPARVVKTPPPQPPVEVSPGAGAAEAATPPPEETPAPAPDDTPKSADDVVLIPDTVAPDSLLTGIGPAELPTEAAFPQDLAEDEVPHPNWTEEYAQVIEAVWGSKLGQLLHSYLYSQSPNQSHSTEILVQRIFESDNTLMPLSAVQLMVEDLQFKDELDTKQIQRLMVLYVDIQRREREIFNYPGKGVAYPAIVTFIGMLPLGYPPVRRAIMKWGARWINKIPLIVRPTNIQNILLNRINQLGSKTRFEIGFVVGTYFKYVGPIELIYIMYFDFEEQRIDHSIDEKIAKLKDMPEFNDFVTELTHL